MQPPPIVTFDVVQTLALGGVALFLGYYLKRLLPALARYNIPAPVVGGLLVSLVMLAAQRRGVTLIGFDTSTPAAAADCLLHDHRLRRQPVAAAYRRAAGAGVFPVVDHRRHPPERRRAWPWRY